MAPTETHNDNPVPLFPFSDETVTLNSVADTEVCYSNVREHEYICDSLLQKTNLCMNELAFQSPQRKSLISFCIPLTNVMSFTLSLGSFFFFFFFTDHVEFSCDDRKTTYGAFMSKYPYPTSTSVVVTQSV